MKLYVHATQSISLAVRNERTEVGATVVEYALLIGMIAIVCIGALTFLGTSASDGLSPAAESLAA